MALDQQRSSDDAQLLLVDLPRDVLVQCLPRKYSPAVPATCRLLRELSKLAAREFSIICDPRIRNITTTACCESDDWDGTHNNYECPLFHKLTAATLLPNLTDLYLNNLPSECGVPTIRLLSRLTSLTRLELPSKRHPEIVAASERGTDRGLRIAMQAEAERCLNTADSLTAALAPLTQLQSLNLQGNAIQAEWNSSLSFLTALTQLSRLDFHGQDTELQHEEFTVLQHLSVLRYLSLSSHSLVLDSNAMTGECVNHLAGLPLQTLLLIRCGDVFCESCDEWHGDKVTDPDIKALSSLTTLQHLEMVSCWAQDVDLSPLSALTGVTCLHLDSPASAGRMRAFSPASIAAVSALTAVRHLSLSRTGLTDMVGALPQLARMTQLERLQLRANGVASGAADALVPLTALTQLDLSGHKIVLAHALTALELLQQLDVSRARLDNAAMQTLTALSSLRDLDVSKNRLQGAGGTQQLARLTALTKLAVSKNALGNEGVQQLAALRALRSLDLKTTECGDAGVHAVAQLPSLTFLNLGKNALCASCVPALASAPALRHLNMRGNKLGVLGGNAARNLSQLTYIALSGNGARMVERKLMGIIATANGIACDFPLPGAFEPF